MSNDLSVNMRRAAMDRKSDERRQAALALEQSVKMQRDAFYASLLTQLDEYAKQQGWLKSQMLRLAGVMELHDFSVYYANHSSAYDGEKY